MKNYYKISEISKLYDIGVDSLRYYEKLGILTPKRDTNGYRLYNLTDLYKLNIIRDLRALDFSMSQIKDYLDKQSLANTLELLHQEETLINQEIANLKSRRTIIQDRIRSLTLSQKIEAGKMQIRNFPTRYCVRLNEHITRDEEMDLIIKKLHQKHEDKIRDLTLHLGEEVKDLRFVNCTGVREGNKIRLTSVLYPFEFAGIELFR